MQYHTTNDIFSLYLAYQSKVYSSTVHYLLRSENETARFLFLFFKQASCTITDLHFCYFNSWKRDRIVPRDCEWV
jgi:hypothetical protein